jgi:hypothetical protein
MADELVVLNKVQKFLKEQYQNVGDNMIAGSIDNMEKYKYMLGQAHAYQYISQEISNLLDNKEQNEKRAENVIDLTRDPKA